MNFVDESMYDIVISHYLNSMIDLGFNFPVDEYEYVEPWALLGDRDIDLIGLLYLAKKIKTTNNRLQSNGSYNGCWRTFGGDKLIKSSTGKVLGYKKLFKFIPENQRDMVYSYPLMEESNEIYWLMEEYRVHKKFKQDKVICRLRLLYGTQLHNLHRAHLRGC